ncbi:arabinose-5-phosphate isomerase [Panacagrimonas perspica]|uniref:Arabinose 5-phosphate isomerase n=1 Tax=Panacagrimonas perspica TaxID=381431 RepID=A0A4V6RR11_9GAMM|nr:KpsF/GutQ family sugar-phosphate isomerase [Panacagrimonas perspica]TDU30830.1 arabinose-5-phosphate isomerase [Panacagrimonas perspica]THD01641.1 D-arabinose 5-phosphate isomerase [Panacagrimonas perspica]
MPQDPDFQTLGRRTLEIERDAVSALIERIDASFSRGCALMLACKGRVVVTGMGKSGHIGGKIAATLASTGTPSFFVHPGEASHGDLGMITRQDVVIAISNSGETPEVLTILPLFKRMGAPLIAMTGKPASTLAKAADVHLDVSVEQEACPLNLAPTASTTATLAMGDALAVALLEARGFTSEDFALSHPGGALGRRLLLKIRDVMRTGDALPRVAPGTLLTGALLEMTRKGLGMTAIVKPDGVVAGLYTDGDLRRTLDQGIDVRTAKIDEVMTPGGKSVEADHLAVEAVALMEKHKISALLVKDAQGRLEGVIHMHDLLRAGVV